MTLQTIGERAANETDPQSAYRWRCPLCSAQSALYIDRTPATGDFEAHLGTHTIQDAFAIVKAQPWLKTFDLVDA